MNGRGASQYQGLNEQDSAAIIVAPPCGLAVRIAHVEGVPGEPASQAGSKGLKVPRHSPLLPSDQLIMSVMVEPGPSPILATPFTDPWPRSRKSLDRTEPCSACPSNCHPLGVAAGIRWR